MEVRRSLVPCEVRHQWDAPILRHETSQKRESQREPLEGLEVQTVQQLGPWKYNGCAGHRQG